MMDAPTFWGLVITVLGTGASIWGASISLKQAKAAKASADEASRVHGQLINQRKTSELAELKVHCEKAIKCMEKYGPSAAPTSVMGVRSKPDADEVQNLILEANKIRGAFLKGEVDVFVSKVTPILEKFVDPAQNANVKSNGQAILMEVSSFLSVVKASLDSKREHVETRA
jgi:hypothetical protein